MVPKLTSCDMFRMLLKYSMSTEDGFVGGERVNPAGVWWVALMSNVWHCRGY